MMRGLTSCQGGGQRDVVSLSETAENKWLWFLQYQHRPKPRHYDTLEEARAALAARYEQVKREQ
jgi:hypothetical protein